MAIRIEGKQVELRPVKEKRLEALPLDVMWTFDFYETEFLGHQLTVLNLKKGKQLTPMQLEKYQERIAPSFDAPIVFQLQPMPTYQRQRLAERGVYFIISGKYAVLPFLYANRKISERETARQLTPIAQYLLLWHLQKSSLEGLSVREVSEQIPQSYLNLARAVTTLEDLGLCECQQEGKSKRLHFKEDGKTLWEQALPYLDSPVKEVFFCNEIKPQGFVSGINALAHYTHLNPEEQTTFGFNKSDAGSLKVSGKNPIEGNIRVEIWKYAPITADGYVDRLSLALSLKNDKDPRVEKEIEQMLDRIFIHDEQ